MWELLVYYLLQTLLACNFSITSFVDVASGKFFVKRLLQTSLVRQWWVEFRSKTCLPQTSCCFLMFTDITTVFGVPES